MEAIGFQVMDREKLFEGVYSEWVSPFAFICFHFNIIACCHSHFCSHQPSDCNKRRLSIRGSKSESEKKRERERRSKLTNLLFAFFFYTGRFSQCTRRVSMSWFDQCLANHTILTLSFFSFSLIHFFPFSFADTVASRCTNDRSYTSGAVFLTTNCILLPFVDASKVASRANQYDSQPCNCLRERLVSRWVSFRFSFFSILFADNDIILQSFLLI